ncbi:hypothetical protein Tco_1052339 [Tanacetum coccineum]
MLGITFMGSGKTLVFVLPLIMTALQEKSMMPIAAGIWISKIRHLLCIELLRYAVTVGYSSKRGVRIVVATTPGKWRVQQRSSLPKKTAALTTESVLNNVFDAISNPKLPIVVYKCVFSKTCGVHARLLTLVLSRSAWRNLGFEDDIRELLVKLITVNVGGGVTNLDVIQEVEYVKQELKLVYLLECLQKTLPPDLVFCETKADVDNIDEYLLFKRSGSKEPEDVGKQELPRVLLKRIKLRLHYCIRDCPKLEHQKSQQTMVRGGITSVREDIEEKYEGNLGHSHTFEHIHPCTYTCLKSLWKSPSDEAELFNVVAAIDDRTSRYC